MFKKLAEPQLNHQVLVNRLYSESNSIDGLYSAYMGDKYYRYYYSKWFDYEKASLELNKKGLDIFSFNLAGFFLGIGWMCYRKMYGWAFFITTCVTLIDLMYMYAKGAESDNNFILLLVTILPIILIGFLGNLFYLMHCSKKIKSASNQFSDTRSLEQYLVSQGGTSWIGAIFGTIGVGVFNILLYVLLIPEWALQ